MKTFYNVLFPFFLNFGQVFSFFNRMRLLQAFFFQGNFIKLAIKLLDHLQLLFRHIFDINKAVACKLVRCNKFIQL